MDTKSSVPQESSAGRAANGIKVLLVAGNDEHKWHNWERTTPRIQEELERDPRIRVTVTRNVEDLAGLRRDGYDVLALNYCNWKDPRQLADAAKGGLVDFASQGGGLLVLHFANGAFHFSLPDAGASDWPEYRRIVRRVWNHYADWDTKSAHDPFGRFAVSIVKDDHPITRGLKAFEVEDELYYDQAGDEPIEPLLAARSKVTGRDEPMAWTYCYGKGRVFQTLLGHSETAYAAWEAGEILRRAAIWAAPRG